MYNIARVDSKKVIQAEYRDWFSPLDTVFDLKGKAQIIGYVENNVAMVFPIAQSESSMYFGELKKYSSNSIFSIAQNGYKTFKIGQQVIGAGNIYYVVGFNLNEALVVNGSGEYFTFKYEQLKK